MKDNLSSILSSRRLSSRCIFDRTKLCHQYCPNHYTAYRPVPIKIAQFQHLSAAVNAVGVPKHTPLFETAGTITKKPTEHSIPITPRHHTSILSTHPLVKLLTHSTHPNCILRPIIIPEPFPPPSPIPSYSHRS